MTKRTGEDDAGEDIRRIGLAAGDEQVPKIGRGKHKLRIPARQLLAILTTLTALIVVIAFTRPCARGVAKIFKSYEAPADAGAPRYIPLPPVPPPTPSR